MITYDINEETKTIKCTLEGEEIKNCMINHLNKILHNYPNNMIKVDTTQLKLSSSYTGIAKYASDETIEFNIDTGKTIARKKAFAKMNKAIAKRFNRIMKNAQYVYENTLCNSFDYDNVVKDIQRKLKRY